MGGIKKQLCGDGTDVWRHGSAEVGSVLWQRYLFDFRRINIYFLFCRTNSVRDLIFV
jgi:hypothetical protein